MRQYHAYPIQPHMQDHASVVASRFDGRLWQDAHRSTMVHGVYECLLASDELCKKDVHQALASCDEFSMLIGTTKMHQMWTALQVAAPLRGKLSWLSICVCVCVCLCVCAFHRGFLFCNLMLASCQWL